MDMVEHGRVVIGGFSDMGGDDAEKVVHEVLLSVPGYQGPQGPPGNGKNLELRTILEKNMFMGQPLNPMTGTSGS